MKKNEQKIEYELTCKILEADLVVSMTKFFTMNVFCKVIF